MDTVYFVDLPGYGYAKVSNAERRRWDELINSYFEAERRTTLLVQLLDSRHAPSADDVQMLEYLQYHQIPFVATLTKADKLKKTQQQAAMAGVHRTAGALRLPKGLSDQRREGAGH